MLHGFFIMKFLSKTLLRGLSVTLPVALTAYIINWLARSSESISKSLITTLVPKEYYIPGMGIILLIIIIFTAGLLMYSWVAQKLWNTLDHLLRNAPLISSIYNPTRDLMSLFGGDFAQQLGKPVLIQIPGTSMDTLGFITRNDLKDLPEGLNKENHIVVYVQWSSQIGGYCFIVPKEAVKEVNMSAEDGLRWSLTAGLSAPTSNKKHE